MVAPSELLPVMVRALGLQVPGHQSRGDDQRFLALEVELLWEIRVAHTS